MLQDGYHADGPGTTRVRLKARERASSSGSASVSPWRTASGRDRCASTNAASQPGSARTSSSAKTTRSAVAARQPTLRASPGPAAELASIARSRRPGTPRASSSAVPSVEPLSTTTTSQLAPSCDRMLWRRASSRPARLRVATTTVTSGAPELTRRASQFDELAVDGRRARRRLGPREARRPPPAALDQLVA